MYRKWRLLSQIVNEKEIIPELQAVSADRSDRIWWQQDGDPAHRNHTVKEYLLGTFHLGIIRVGYDSERLPRSLDLTPYNFILWGSSDKPGLREIIHRFGRFENSHHNINRFVKANPVLIRKVLTSMRAVESKFASIEMAGMLRAMESKRFVCAIQYEMRNYVLLFIYFSIATCF